jgi:molecular chaperone GrpE
MPASEETGSGPVIHDHRRIDPVTGQVRGKHAASKPAGTRGAGRPAAGPEAAGTQAAGTQADATQAGDTQAGGPAGDQPEDKHDKHEERDAAATLESPEEASEMVTGQVIKDGKRAADVAAQLAERTADLQRLQAEYANYRKRVDRDRAAVQEQAIVKTLTGLIPVLDAINQAREHGELSGGFEKVADSLLAALGRLGLVTYGDKGDPFDPKIHEALTYTDSPDVAEDTCVEIIFPGYKVGDRILRPAKVAVAAPATGPDGASNEVEWPDAEEGN